MEPIYPLQQHGYSRPKTFFIGIQPHGNYRMQFCLCHCLLLHFPVFFSIPQPCLPGNSPAAVLFLIYCPFFRIVNKVSCIQNNRKEDITMKGYYNNSGYMGYVDGHWVLFASESDYREYMSE